jgi:hypothetical protein
MVGVTLPRSLTTDVPIVVCTDIDEIIIRDVSEIDVNTIAIRGSWWTTLVDPPRGWPSVTNKSVLVY